MNEVSFLGLGEQNSNQKVKNDVVVTRQMNKMDDDVSLPLTTGDIFGR